MAVGGFSVLDNHLHVLLRLDPDVAEAWSDEEVVRRWGRLYPPRDKSRRPMPVTEHWVQWRLSDALWVATARQRLQSLSWFMKCLKEPLSRLANRQDKARGTFFEGRFKSVAVCDEEALLAISVYIDLNPVAAQVATTPETSDYTSIKQRVEHVETQVRPLCWPQRKTAVLPARVPQPVWRILFGSVRSKTAVGWIRRAKE